MLTIIDYKVNNMQESAEISGFPMRAKPDSGMFVDHDKNLERMIRLAKAPQGSGHDCALKGINVLFTIDAPTYWWIQALRYKHFDIVSSSSTMHKATAVDWSERCTSRVWPEFINRLKKEIATYHELQGDAKLQKFLDIKANIPGGFKLFAGVTTNYLQLKTMYNQRKNHKLLEWQHFCRFLSSKLPHFREMVGE